ncbi:hypothetical protein SprV_0602144600 [Sparganum proliferum]
MLLFHIRRLQYTRAVNAHPIHESVGHLRTQCAINPTTPTSAHTLAPAANPTFTVTPVNANHTVAVPPPLPTDTIPTPPQHLHRPQQPAPPPPRLQALPLRWDDVRRPINFRHHQHPYLQRRGLGPCLSSLRSHIHLTHRQGRSLANPSHRDRRTSAWSTNLHPPHPLQLPSLRLRIQPTHGLNRSDEHSRGPAVDNRQLNHIITSSPIYIAQHYRPQSPNCHRPRKWEVDISVPAT